MQGLMINTIAVFVIIGIITTGSTLATPVPGTRCSPIIPEENCRNALSTTEAENLITTILSDLDDSDDVLWNLRRLTNTTNEQPGPYGLDNTGDRLCQSRSNASDCIARSVYRFKCEVPVVADIMKNEFIRKLVQEESNYAAEFETILNNLSIIFDLKSLISQYQPLNSCTVPEESCQPTFNSTGLDRIVLIQSVAADIFELQADLKVALRGFLLEISNSS